MTTVEQALSRLTTTADAFATTEQKAAYLYAVASCLGTKAPDVLVFALDLADERVAEVGL